MGNKNTSSQIQDVASGKGFICNNEKEYTHHRTTNLSFSCESCGYTLVSSFLTMKRGNGCKKCARKVSKSIVDYVYKFASDNKLIIHNGDEYEHQRTKLKWECKCCGKIFSRTLDSCKRSDNPICCSPYLDKREDFARDVKLKTIGKVEKRLGIKLISKRCKSLFLSIKREWSCNRCENIFNASISTLKKRKISGCYDCSRQDQTQRNRINEENILELIKGKYSLNNKGAYFHSNARNLELQCGDCKKEFRLSYDKLMIGRGCPHCSKMDQREMRYQEEFYNKVVLFLESNTVKYKIKKEYNTKTNGRIDIVIWIKNKTYPNELKHDDSYWNPARIGSQLEKYNEYFLSKNCDKVFLVSPKGRYGLSEKDFFKELTELIQKT